MLVLRSEDLFNVEIGVCSCKLEQFLNIAPFPIETSIPRTNSGLGEARDVPVAVRRGLEKQLAPTFNWLETELGLRW